MLSTKSVDNFVDEMVTTPLKAHKNDYVANLVKKQPPEKTAY